MGIVRTLRFRRTDRWLLRGAVALLVVLASVASPVVAASETSASESITIDVRDTGRRFDGVGALSAGASTRLLYDYPEPERSQILDYMFKPGYGAALDILKVEIGGDTNSTSGSEPSHMRAPGKVNCTRGYEWWLMREAKRRNPDIELAALEWGAPGWFDGGFWSQDNIDYILAWLGCAKQHGLDIDYIGGWNERGYDKSWYVDLAAALDKAGYDVKVVAADSFSWDVAADMKADPAFNKAVDVVGMHFVCGHRTEYKQCASTEVARNLGKPLWMSENSAMSHNAGAAPLARALNRMYVDAKLTGYISWSAVSAWYANLPIADTGLLLAEWPWSGYYEVGQSVWVNAHTTQFTEPGWKYIDSASGYLDSGASYVSLKSPDAHDFSTIIETMDADKPATVSVHPVGGVADRPVHIWSTNLRSADTRDDFVHRRTVQPDDGGFTVKLAPGHVYTLSTTTGQGKGEAASQATVHEQMPLPYVQNFENLKQGDIARYFSDLDGAFEAVRCGGERSGMCYRQQTESQPIVWSDAGYMDPTTVFGDPRWSGNYTVSTDFMLEEKGYVELLGRISAVPGFDPTVGGYHLRVHSDGNWELYSGDYHAGRTSLASGKTAVGTDTWHTMSLRMRGSTIDVRIDGERVARVTDTRQTTGNVGLRVSGWEHAQFDNVAVKPSAPDPNLLPQEPMSASATSAQGFYAGYTYEAANAVDDRPETIWHTEFDPSKPALPESITVDLGRAQEIGGLLVQPRYDRSANGMITRYNILVSMDGKHFTKVASGTWSVTSSTKAVDLSESVSARYVRLQAVAAVNGNAAVGEINVVGSPTS